MRDAVDQLLGDGVPPSAAHLEDLTLQVRGHIQLLMPEVEKAAEALPPDSVPRYCALACLGEAGRKLRLEPGPGLPRALAHARRLARVLAALCEHHEGLGNQ